ncbi:MAG: hypothetical protein L0323_09830 [Planctomycetes bacterium]|nr:hypothetical protein [Planctomycetota bacterium]
MRWKRSLVATYLFLAAAPASMGQVITFSEDFEGGALGAYTETDPAGLPAATLWHGEAFCDGVAPIPGSMGTNAASYNQGDIALYTYATGGANAGAIESPVIASGVCSIRTLAFEYMKQTEAGGSATFDQCFVEARPPAGVYSTLTQITGNSVCPASLAVSVAVPGSGAWQHRFRFDTVDGVANAFQGWTVDNVVASEAVFAENFEGGGLGAYTETDPAGVPAATLWHGEGFCDGVAPIPASMGTNAASYNQGDIAIYTYATVGANTGAIESPVIPSAAGAIRTLVFEYTKQTEGGGTGTFDQCFVEARPPAGVYSVLTQITGNSVCPASLGVSVAVPGAGAWQHRFRFDTVDGAFNAFQGWTVDNVVATEAAFAENFEGGGLGAYTETDPAGVPAATLWHGEGFCDGVTPIPGSMGTNAASYNQGDIAIYTYATVGANAGAIESPVIPSAVGTARTLVFEYSKQTEAGGTGSFDQCFVEARPPLGVYSTLTQIVGNSVCPSSLGVSVSVPGAGPWQHRFRFNTVDGVANAFQGWTVDNVVAMQTSGTAGGFVTTPTGCGGPPFSVLTPGGNPSLGGTVSFTMGSPAFSLIWIGPPAAAPLCPAGCTLGAALAIVLPGPSLIIPVPCDTALIGGSISVQGGNALAPGGCGVIPFGVPFTVTDTVAVTIG